jgi:small neutral amino acid transporter SnatA (MarC family)
MWANCLYTSISVNLSHLSHLRVMLHECYYECIVYMSFKMWGEIECGVLGARVRLLRIGSQMRN